MLHLKRRNLMITWKKVKHLLFHCHTFWQWKRAYKCPVCGKRYRCYWDGNDVVDWGTDICADCYKKIDAGELKRADYPADLNAHKKQLGSVAILKGKS
jgi:hypothetical protein